MILEMKMQKYNFDERYFKGEKLQSGWVRSSDFEDKPIKE